LFGLLVILPGFGFLFNLGHQGPVANGHTHAVHGGPGGGRKDVYGFQRSFACVLVNLGHQDIGNDAGYVDLSRGGFQGKPVDFGIIAFNEKIGR